MWTVSNWLERNKTLTQCGKYSWKKSILANQHSSLTTFISFVLNENVQQAKKSGQLQKYVWIQNLCRSYRKATLFWETWHKHFLMVQWYGRWCKEVRGKILRTGEQNNSTTIRSRDTMHWRPPIQGRRNWISWRIVKSMLTNCSEMPVFGSHW